MQYHRGLLRQRGHGWGALLRIGGKAIAKAVAKHAIPAAVQAVGGILESKQPAQTGQGVVDVVDFITNSAMLIDKVRSGDKTPLKGIYHKGKYITEKTQRGRGKRRVKRKKQKGKGMFTDLLKRGAKQALRAAAQTGLDVLDNKRSLKEAIKTHGIRAIKSTAQPLLARGGPKKLQRRPVKRPVKSSRPIKRPVKRPGSRPIKRPVKSSRPIKRPVKAPIKRPVKRPIKRPVKAPVKRPIKRSVKRPIKKTRALDIFD